MSWQGKRIWVAGHTGLVGSALVGRLTSEDVELITVSHAALDLRRQKEVEDWMEEARPDIILLAAAKVGGIAANLQAPAEFLYDNLAIAQTIIHQAWKQKTGKLVFLGSSCIYPKFAPQPISPDALLSGPLEPSNEAYAIAKIAGIKLCQSYRRQYGCDFISVMPCNLYGPGDRWDTSSSHVIPALLTRMHRAKQQGDKSVTIWGSGRPLREFLYADDLANAIFLAGQHYEEEEPLNIGSGEEVSIAALAETIRSVVGFKGRLNFDLSMPEGTPRKILDSSRIRDLGWSPRIKLIEGLEKTYDDLLKS